MMTDNKWAYTTLEEIMMGGMYSHHYMLVTAHPMVKVYAKLLTKWRPHGENDNR